MKKFFIISTLILSVLTACHKVEYNGQTGKILHKQYDPALNINYIMADVEQTWDTLRIDVDRDGNTDLKICFQYNTPYIIGSEDWQLSVIYDDFISNNLWWWNRDFRVSGLEPICLRHTVDGGYCYGWIDAYSAWGSEGQVDAVRFYLRETAYCTCPDYPLKWGEK